MTETTKTEIFENFQELGNNYRNILLSRSRAALYLSPSRYTQILINMTHTRRAREITIRKR